MSVKSGNTVGGGASNSPPGATPNTTPNTTEQQQHTTTTTTTTTKNNNNNVNYSKGEIVLCGHHKKLKTLRKKYFVLRGETPDTSARLEYYDSEKKFKNGQPPKRSIPLKTCFNINKRNDTKYKHVIALYTKDDCFCIILDSEDELDDWLKALLSLQHGEEAADGDTPRPTFEHVWQVTVCNRGLGTFGIIGNYRLCLTDKTLSLINSKTSNVIDLDLSTIRSCGPLQNYFYLEIGRSSALGAGELWMDTEDSNIAQNIYSTVFHAMSTNSNKQDDLGPKGRNRSSSATESSKPTVENLKQPIMSFGFPKTHIFSQGGLTDWSGNINHQRTQSLPLETPAPSITDHTLIQPLRVTKRSNQSFKCMIGGRERCDSMPSRVRTASEGNHVWCSRQPQQNHHRRNYGCEISLSPPSGSPVSPPSVGCSTDSGSSYSLADETDIGYPEMDTTNRYGISLTPDEAIVEEDCPDSPCCYTQMAPTSSDDGYVDMSPKGRYNNASPSASTSSITSGTPSTDTRFSDYPLDKVSSYIIQSEETDEWPVRAYSVGSKPETYRKHKSSLMQASDYAARVRASSVGSKNKKPNRILAAIQQAQHHQYQHPSAKSSSAPILTQTQKGFSSHSSLGPMDDFVEMDFSSVSRKNTNKFGYIEMKPTTKMNTNNSGYVEMKPPGGSQNHNDNYLDMNPSNSSPSKSMNDETFVDLHRIATNDYKEMDGRRKLSTKVISTSPNSWTTAFGDYVDMTKKSEQNLPFSSPKLFDFLPNKPETSQQPPITTPDGYVEMTLGNKKQHHHQRQSSLDSAKVIPEDNEDYLEMSIGESKKKSNKKEKQRSQPITIQNNQFSTNKHASSPLSSGGSCSASAFFTRKHSSGTPPRTTMHLPLSNNTNNVSGGTTSPYSSLPRHRSRKNSSRRDSKDSSTTSSVVTTPSSSSTLFPMSLNSPSSPATSSNNCEIITVNTNAASCSGGSLKIPAAVLNTTYKVGKITKPFCNKSDDYTMMDFEFNKKVEKNKSNHNNCSDNSEYVNYNPASQRIFNNDIEAEKEAKTNSNTITQKSVNDLLTSYILENDSTCFRPIKETPSGEIEEESHYEILSKRNNPPGMTITATTTTTTPRPSSVSSESNKMPLLSRPSSTSSDGCSSSTCTLVGSRPESVNSEQLHYASLDLVTNIVAMNNSDGDGDAGPNNCSPRNVKSSPTSAEILTENEAFSYAEIDFAKSTLPNTKVKH